MREISNLDLKIQLTNEYLRTGGVEKIFDVNLLRDLMNVKFDINGKANPETITSRLNAFMLAILGSHSLPPVQIDNYISEYASFIQKSLFFDQNKIETEEQVDELFQKYKQTDNILFRGQREAKWRLYSTIQRWWIWDKIEETGINFNSFLKNIIENGKTDLTDKITNIFKEINADTINDVAVLGFLQHHNCPTPLLDWTYSFNTAMFFGIDGLEHNESPREIDHYFSVYYVEEKHFENGGMRTLLSESLHTVGEELKLGLIAQIAKDEEQRIEMENHFKERSFFDKNRFNGSGLIRHMTKIEYLLNIPLSYFSDRDLASGIAFSLTNSENIRKQNGVFTWNSHYSKPLEVIGNEQYSEAKLESEPNDYRFCECYNINKNLVGYISEKLKELNISTEILYPDKEIDLKYIYEQNKKNKV